MNAMLALQEPEIEEIEYDEFAENEECSTSQSATSTTGMPGKWFSAVVVTGVLLAQPASAENHFIAHPTSHSISFGDDFISNESTSTCSPIWVQEPIAKILSEKDRLLDVRHFLALSTTELATILGVSRQTVYAWLQGGTDIRAANLARLNLLHSLARECRATLGKPLHRSLIRADIEGKSLLSILSEETLDSSLAKRQLSDLMARVASETKKPDTISGRSRALGFKPMPEWMQSESIGSATDRLSLEG